MWFKYIQTNKYEQPVIFLFFLSKVYQDSIDFRFYEKRLYDHTVYFEHNISTHIVVAFKWRKHNSLYLSIIHMLRSNLFFFIFSICNKLKVCPWMMNGLYTCLMDCKSVQYSVLCTYSNICLQSMVWNKNL